MLNKSSTQQVALFLFAHQDDETGVFQKIIDEKQNGHRVCCAYLTDGACNGVSSIRRNQESLSVLHQLGVQEQDVYFAGSALAIPDGQLHEHLESTANWIDEWITSFAHVVSICVPAWEGGHQDHDALHAITVSVADGLGVLRCVRQFSLYNAHCCIGPFFRVLAPLPMNGVVEETRIPWKYRFHFLRYCLSYPSQAKTWLGIFPFFAFHYLHSGKQTLQPVSSERIRLRPHKGALYYEKRGFFTWEKLANKLAHWQASSALIRQLRQGRKVRVENE
jgi:LmbE family N-acetylglucosaminyl deacetylase